MTSSGGRFRLEKEFDAVRGHVIPKTVTRKHVWSVCVMLGSINSSSHAKCRILRRSGHTGETFPLLLLFTSLLRSAPPSAPCALATAASTRAAQRRLATSQLLSGSAKSARCWRDWSGSWTTWFQNKTSLFSDVWWGHPKNDPRASSPWSDYNPQWGI